MSESSGEIEKRGGTPDVPHLIRAGGEWAVLAYREFLDNPNWSAAKRTVSRNVLGRFCRWAEARGLTLESISASEVKAYFAETPEERYLAPVGDLLRRLAAAGVVTGKPVRRKAMRKKATAVPEIIRAAGERAVAAYREILDDPKWSAGTRRLYGRRARRFFRWAEARGLTLETIAGADAAAYAAEIAARRSPQAANLALTAVRGLFRHLAGSGVISANPFETPRLGSREVSGDVTGSRLEAEDRRAAAGWRLLPRAGPESRLGRGHGAEQGGGDRLDGAERLAQGAGGPGCGYACGDRAGDRLRRASSPAAGDAARRASEGRRRGTLRPGGGPGHGPGMVGPELDHRHRQVRPVAGAIQGGRPVRPPQEYPLGGGG